MRRRSAGLIASAQRSMSFGEVAREAADDGVLGALGDLVDGVEIAFRRDREAGLDDVDAHLVEQLGDFELLLVGHGGAGRLLAVAQCGVENDDAVLARIWSACSWNWSFWSLRPGRRALSGFRSGSPPECPGAQRPAGPQGRISRRRPPIRRAETLMRAASDPAMSAARTIALISWRVDMPFKNPRLRTPTLPQRQKQSVSVRSGHPV